MAAHRTAQGRSSNAGADPEADVGYPQAARRGSNALRDHGGDGLLGRYRMAALSQAMSDLDDALSPPQRIRTLNKALAWGAEWERAYYEERRARLREIKSLHDRIFELEHALKTEQFERVLDAAPKG